MTRANKCGMAFIAMLTTLAVAFSLLCVPGRAKEGNGILPCRETVYQANATGTGYGYNDTDAGDIPVPAEDEESQQNAADYTVTMKQHLVVSYATWCEMIRSPKYSADNLRDDETFPAQYLRVSTDEKPVADADLTVESRGKDAVQTRANNVVLRVDTSRYGETSDAPKADLYIYTVGSTASVSIGSLVLFRCVCRNSGMRGVCMPTGGTRNTCLRPSRRSSRQR